jgi:hypothetical protein
MATFSQTMLTEREHEERQPETLTKLGAMLTECEHEEPWR